MLAVLTEGAGRGGGAQEAGSSLSQLSTQTVFSMLSHLSQWSRLSLSTKPKHSGRRAGPGPEPDLDPDNDPETDLELDLKPDPDLDHDLDLNLPDL